MRVLVMLDPYLVCKSPTRLCGAFIWRAIWDDARCSLFRRFAPYEPVLLRKSLGSQIRISLQIITPCVAGGYYLEGPRR